jgi:hypothetical protein
LWARNAYILGRKPEGKRTRRIWMDSIKTDLKMKRCESVNCIQEAWNRIQWRALVNTVMTWRAPQKEGNFSIGEEMGITHTNTTKVLKNKRSKEMARAFRKISRKPILEAVISIQTGIKTPGT